MSTGDGAPPKYMFCGKAITSYNGGAIDADAQRERVGESMKRQCMEKMDDVDTGCNLTDAVDDHDYLRKCPDTHVTIGVASPEFEFGCHFRHCQLATTLRKDTTVYCGYFNDGNGYAGGCGTLDGIRPPATSRIFDRPLTIAGLPLPIPEYEGNLGPDDYDRMFYHCPTGMTDAGYEDVNIDGIGQQKFRKCVFEA